VSGLTDARTTLERFEALESCLLTLVQDVRALKADVQRLSDNQQSLEPFWDADQVAKILGVDVAYVYSQARSRKIPSVKLGKYRRFSPDQIRKWLDRKRSDANT
jgi:excisionase family DNA binding protein